VRRALLPLVRVEGAPSELSDEALVAACAMGERAALGALFDRHCDAVRRFLARISGARDVDLDDLVQTTFETLTRAAGRFDGRSEVRTWLLGIASNVARHHVRSLARQQRLTDAVAASPPVDETDVAAQAIAHERTALLHEAILALPVKLREAFVLVYLEALPGRDVARLLGVREGTLWKRLFEARAALRDALKGVEP